MHEKWINDRENRLSGKRLELSILHGIRNTYYCLFSRSQKNDMPEHEKLMCECADVQMCEFF